MITEGNFFVGVLRNIVYLPNIRTEYIHASLGKIPSILCFVAANDAQEVIPFEKLDHSFISVNSVRHCQQGLKEAYVKKYEQPRTSLFSHRVPGATPGPF